MNFSGTLSSPEQPGGGEETFSFVGGMTNDNSQVTFTYEHQERGIIFLADRPYDAGRAPTDGDYSSSFNVSTYAYNYRLLDDWTAPDGRVFKKGTYFQMLHVQVTQDLLKMVLPIHGETVLQMV